ncbi:MAG: 50S ribosomal protein L29 [Spirochaetia bacterium]
MRDSFRDMTFEELFQKREELKKKYRDLRFNMVVGHVDNPLEKRELRRKIARLNTLIFNYDTENTQVTSETEE